MHLLKIKQNGVEKVADYSFEKAIVKQKGNWYMKPDCTLSDLLHYRLTSQDIESGIIEKIVTVVNAYDDCIQDDIIFTSNSKHIKYRTICLLTANSNSRKRSHVYQRMLLSYILSDCGISQNNIAKLLMKDRTTIHHYIDQHDQRLNDTAQYSRAYDILKLRVSNVMLEHYIEDSYNEINLHKLRSQIENLIISMQRTSKIISKLEKNIEEKVKQDLVSNSN